MEKKEKRIYETPRLTTVTFRAERGYAESLRVSSIAIWSWIAGDANIENQTHLEDYGVVNNWDQNTNTFWQ